MTSLDVLELSGLIILQELLQMYWVEISYEYGCL